MEKRLTMILACLFLSVGMALAQKAVTGTVVSQEDGQPIIGATVRVEGANVGAVTDADGKFSLSMPSGHNKLKVTYVGMIDQDVTVKGNSVRVVLAPDETNLDEVMVVAYGTAKKSAFTGSAAVVDNEEISKSAVANPVGALTGKVAGVQINSSTGQPGQESFSINIRGITSTMAGTSPLIIVDGAPFEGDMSTISNQDIASMTVLKDAASAALYGARGANGVVIITTKSADQGKSSITLDAKWGSNSRAIPDYKYINNAAGYYEMWYSGLYNYAVNVRGADAATANTWANQNLTASNEFGLGYNVFTVPNGQNLIGTNGKLNPNATLGNVISYNGNSYTLMPDDWVDAAFQNGLRQEYTLTASGSNNKGTFYGSVNYLDNEGITAGSDFKRLTSRLKADYQIKDWLKVAGNFSYAHFNSDFLQGDGESAYNGNLFSVIRMAPIYPLYIRDGQGNIMTDSKTGLPSYDWGDGSVIGLTRPVFTQANPLNSLLIETHNYEGNNLSAVGSAEIRFLKDFKFTTLNNVMLQESRQTDTTNPYFGSYAASGGQNTKYHMRTWSYNYQQLLNWHHVFDKHDVEVMLGHEYYRLRYYYLAANKTNVLSINNTELAGAITNGTADSYTTDYNVEGYFGRAQYNYNSKYFGSVSFRRDASSRFAPENRWGNFWSLGGAWIISKENWFNAPWVDELKFKASYGEQGNDNIGSFYYTERYTISDSNGNISLTPSSTKGNRNITWETNANFNTGFEFSFFRGKLSGSAEFFYRKTSDMLAYFSLPSSTGYMGYYDNVGNMTNTGFELTLNATPIRTKDFTWNLNLNMTTYKNKISYIPEENKTLVVDGVSGYSDGNYFYGEGEPMYTWYMLKYAGVDPENGDALYYVDKTVPVLDADGNPTYDAAGNAITTTERQTTTNSSEATRYLCGTALPDVYGGFGTSFSYKGFDFSVDFSYQLGGKVYDSGYASSMSNSKGYVLHEDLLNAWTPANTNTNIPRFEYNYTSMSATSDRFLTSASYLSLQNVNIGYTLPAKLCNKLGLANVRVYATGDNLWVWSKRQGLDPRQSIAGGSSNEYYSPIRSISGGISITF